MKNETSLNHQTPPIANVLLAAGFTSIREAKRFAKYYGLMKLLNTQIDNTSDDADCISTLLGSYAFTELLKMKLPDGFDKISGYEDAKKWWFETCH